MNQNGLNINKDCGSTHIENLQKFVLENKLDVGFAFDGDADRCIAVDETGMEVHGDYILYVCGKYLKEKWSFGRQHSSCNDHVQSRIVQSFGKVRH